MAKHVAVGVPLMLPTQARLHGCLNRPFKQALQHAQHDVSNKAKEASQTEAKAGRTGEKAETTVTGNRKSTADE